MKGSPMPEIPKLITFDQQQKKILFDGEEFPWYVADGWTIESESNAMSRVTITVFADAAEVTYANGRVREPGDLPASVEELANAPQ